MLNSNYISTGIGTAVVGMSSLKKWLIKLAHSDPRSVESQFETLLCTVHPVLSTADEVYINCQPGTGTKFKNFSYV